VSDLLSRFEQIAPQALALLADPFVQFLFHDSLIWWPFLLTAFAVALIAFWAGHGANRAALGEFRRRFLSRAIWAHRSAQADYAYYIVNSILHPLLVAPLIVGGAAIGGWVEAALAKSFGPIGAPLLALGWARAIYTVFFYLAYDLGRFIAHTLLHDVPLLWQFHKLHHSAEVLTPLTNYRAHPVELFIMATVPSVFTGLVSGVIWYVSAGEVGFYTFLGLHVGIAAFNAIGNLRHWQVWISFGPKLNRWLISPAHHQIHHSREARHFGRNRGFELAIWDRLFGTLYVPIEEEAFHFGLGDESDGAWHRVGRMYFWPFRYALAILGFGRPPVRAGSDGGHS
jgi:sterol desaturase/sphingolipid hydroxylase (fatty acid hydroxylase superfamily)